MKDILLIGGISHLDMSIGRTISSHIAHEHINVRHISAEEAKQLYNFQEAEPIIIKDYSMGDRIHQIIKDKLITNVFDAPKSGQERRRDRRKQLRKQP